MDFILFNFPFCVLNVFLWFLQFLSPWGMWANLPLRVFLNVTYWKRNTVHWCFVSWSFHFGSFEVNLGCTFHQFTRNLVSCKGLRSVAVHYRSLRSSIYCRLTILDERVIFGRCWFCIFLWVVDFPLLVFDFTFVGFR